MYFLRADGIDSTIKLNLPLLAMPTKIVFLGSKPVGHKCLQYMLENSRLLDLEVIAVRTQLRKEFSGDNNLGQLAENFNIPLLNNLDELPECDIIYSVQHHELLKASHIKKAHKIAVNLHLAPLPEYRGCNQFSFAIMDKAPEFGVTVHEIDTRIDHGAVLFEKRFPVRENIWVDELYNETVAEGIALFTASLPPLLQGKYTRVSQQELSVSRPSSIHYRHEIAGLKKLDLDMGKDFIERAVRATYMPGFEPPYFMINDKKVYIHTGKN